MRNAWIQQVFPPHKGRKALQQVMSDCPSDLPRHIRRARFDVPAIQGLTMRLGFCSDYSEETAAFAAETGFTSLQLSAWPDSDANRDTVREVNGCRGISMSTMRKRCSTSVNPSITGRKVKRPSCAGFHAGQQGAVAGLPDPGAPGSRSSAKYRRQEVARTPNRAAFI